MSSNNDSHDTVDAGDERKTTPGYVIFANSCGIFAAILTGILAFYYGLVATGHMPLPVMGVIPVWTMAIILFGGVKGMQWAADCAADRVLSVINRRYASLLRQAERVSDEALERAQESGQWKGIATAYRQDQGDSGDLLPFNRRRGGAS